MGSFVSDHAGICCILIGTSWLSSMSKKTVPCPQSDKSTKDGIFQKKLAKSFISTKSHQFQKHASRLYHFNNTEQQKRLVDKLGRPQLRASVLLCQNLLTLKNCITRRNFKHEKYSYLRNFGRGGCSSKVNYKIKHITD